MRSRGGFRHTLHWLRLRVVGDAREPVPQLDRSRQLAALLVDGPDRSSLCLGDHEHHWSMGTLRGADKPRGAPREACDAASVATRRMLRFETVTQRRYPAGDGGPLPRLSVSRGPGTARRLKEAAKRIAPRAEAALSRRLTNG